jgi:glutamate-5-semialdehyde dehydrogenase
MRLSLTDLQDTLTSMGKKAKLASKRLSLASSDKKKQALRAIAQVIRDNTDTILSANSKDIEAARTANQADAFIDRLLLNVQRVSAMANALDAIAQLNDPVGKVLAEWDRPNGLHIQRVSVPLGVIGVIFESRPNVAADAAALCLLSGNCAILRGGSESFYSVQAIMKCISQGISQSGLPDSCIQMIPTADREAVAIMLKLDQYIDVIVPRGGKSLIQRITQESRIPLFKHLEGICHTYIHHTANKEMAIKLSLNAKLRRPGICGATETILIDKHVAQTILPDLIRQLRENSCEVRGDDTVLGIDEHVIAATESDWQTEYLDKIVAIRCVEGIAEAIAHIQQFGSQHTDAIVAEDVEAVQRFFREVDSAIVMHNASTQFADGGEFGMGAEIGISTGKLHARGPVGVEQLTTFHYRVQGNGQCRPG